MSSDRKLIRRGSHGARRGGKKPPEYVAWCDMIARCENPQNTNYAKYGARGIRVCRRWRRSYADFFADVGTRPAKGFSLGRVDNERGYEPGNVRWQTHREQQNNRRDTRRVDYRGETKPLAEWVVELGLSYHRVLQRLLAGWCPERAFEAPPRFASPPTLNA